MIILCCGNTVKKTLKYFFKLLIAATQLLNLQLITLNIVLIFLMFLWKNYQTVLLLMYI